MSPAHGLILFAHGARDARWAAPFEAVATRVRAARPDVLVRLAFLEFMSPDLAGAGTELVAAGCAHITILPMFLGAGGHVRKDLPLLLEGLRRRWPEAGFDLLTAIGEVDSVMQAMADAAVRAVVAAVGVGGMNKPDEDPSA